MPHQQYICDVAFELNPDTGTFAYSEVVVIGPRQVTGKTELLLPKMTWRCIGLDNALAKWVYENLGRKVRDPGPQTVLYAAQNADEARKKWRRIHLARLLSSQYKDDFTARLQQNQEMFLFRNGSMWSPISGTGKTSGTGDTVDDATIDEAWAQQDSRVEVGLRPAMMTRPWRQLWIASMIPGPTRIDPGKWKYLQHKRQVGRARVEAGVNLGTCLFDWSAAPGMDPSHPDTWWSCMPGLGMTVDEQVIREDFDAMPDQADFESEYLGWEAVAARPKWTVIQRETWAARYDPQSSIEGTCALSVEVDEERRQAWIGIAGHRWDADWHIAIAEPGYQIMPGPSGIEWLMPRLLELIEEVKPCTVVIDPRRPAASFIVELERRGIDVTKPQLQHVAAACGRFFDATGQDADENRVATRLWHVGQPDLDRSLAGAKKWEMGEGTFTFVRKGASSMLSPLYAVVLAMLGVDVKGAGSLPEPEIFV